MQIISYLDRNITTSAFKKEASLDMLLKNQNFSRAKVKNFKIETQATAASFFEEAVFCFSALVSYTTKRKCGAGSSAYRPATFTIFLRREVGMDSGEC